MILAESRNEYFDALESADAGSYQRFVTFIEDRGVDAILLVADSLRAAEFPNINDAVARFRGVYLTRGGYSQVEVDQAGISFLTLIEQELTERAKSLNLAELQFSIGRMSGGKKRTPGDSAYRVPEEASYQTHQINLFVTPPANAFVTRSLIPEVPRDAESEAGLLVRVLETNEVFEARISEVLPAPSTALRLRTQMIVEAILAEAITTLSREADLKLREHG